MKPSLMLRIALAIVLTFGASAPLGAQSITSLRGLGYPLVPSDARTDVLGGLGIGLKGLAVPLTDPAAPAGVRRRGGVLSMASVDQDVTVGNASDEMSAARFPLLRVLFPLGNVVLSAGYGGYLDQSWSLTREGEQTGAGVPVSYEDRIESAGGVGQFQIGAASELGSGFAIGGAVGLYTGSRRLSFQRLFDESEVGPLEPFGETWTVDYSAPLVQLGARWDPNEVLRVAGSVSWAGTLQADSATGPAMDAEYDLPLQVAAGASAYLAPSILATVSGRWSGWSAAGTLDQAVLGSPVTSTTRDTWEVGAGLEWDDPSSRDARSYPLRIGGQYRQLPFSFGAEAPTEWFVGAGAGLRLGADVANPLARVDLTVQRGERSAAGDGATPAVSESAWRLALSLSIFGN